MTLNLSLTFLYVGVRSYGDRNSRTGMLSPLTGAPSMTSYFAIVSDSLYVLGPTPVLSLLRISTSMCLILIRTSRKKILPTTTSLRWYFALAYSNSMCRQSSMPTSILIPGLSSLGGVSVFLTRNRNSWLTVLPYARCIVTRTA